MDKSNLFVGCIVKLSEAAFQRVSMVGPRPQSMREVRGKVIDLMLDKDPIYYRQDMVEVKWEGYEKSVSMVVDLIELDDAVKKDLVNDTSTKG